MAIPAALTTVTVTGRYLQPGGEPLTGEVSFSPLFDRTVVAASDTVLIGGPVSARLVDGAFSVVLPVGDDVDASPTGWGYRVTEYLGRNGSSMPAKQYTVSLPGSLAPGPVDITDLAPGTGSAVSGDVAALPVTGGTLLGDLVVNGFVTTATGTLMPVGIEVRNVADFGALGNNTADDTASIQAAIDAIPIGGGEVHFPTGTFKLTAALVLDSGVTLVGSGDITIVIRQTSTSANCVQGVNVERVGLRGIQLVGPGSGTGHGISLTKGGGNHVAYTSLENVTVDDFGGDGVRIENPIASTFSRVICSSNGGYGFNLFGQNGGAAGTSTTLTSCYGNANTTRRGSGSTTSRTRSWRAAPPTTTASPTSSTRASP